MQDAKACKQGTFRGIIQMKMYKSILPAVNASLLTGAALFVMCGAANAADAYDGSLKDAPVEEGAPDYSISVNGGLTTDYVFRGYSQTDNTAAVFAGADFSYQFFYLGVWASSVDEVTSPGNIEIDLYGGIKKSWNNFDFDVGVIYYAYPDGDTPGGPDLDYFEIKAAIGTKIADLVTVGGKVFYSPDYYAETGEVWTFEGTASTPLPIFDLSLSGTIGTSIGEDEDFALLFGDGEDEYVYWNVGLSKTFKNFTFDVRYWDTDVDSSLSDERVVGTVSFSY